MKKQKIYIPDANIILSALLDEEEYGEMAHSFLYDVFVGNIRLLVPSVWSYEVCNRLSRVKPFSLQKTIDEFQGYRSLCDHAELSIPQIEKAYSITKSFSVSFYDASYHALALLNDGIFITLDKQYCRRAQKLKQVMVLEEYKV